MEKVKILLKVKDIPDGTTVTKLTGTKEYEISSKFAVYGPNRESEPVKLEDGCKFMLSMDGPSTGVNIVGPDRYLLCQFGPKEACEILIDLYNLDFYYDDYDK